MEKFKLDAVDVFNPKKVKIFLSHNMSDESEEVIKTIRDNAEKYLISKYGHNFEIIDNYNHPDAPEHAGRLWHLGKSIQQLGDADAIYFCPGHCGAKGCVVERLISKLYNINILE